jgi:molybdate transport system substrate-binding protein
MVLSSLALKGALEKLKPPGVDIRFDATQAILASLAQGTRADLLILTLEAVNDLKKQGRVKEVHALGSSGVGVAVRAGARRPDISSVDAFIHALVNAESVAHSKVGASGIYFSKLLQERKISLQKRVVVEKGPVGLAVARGEAEIGIQQLCELAPVAGIDIVGPLPEPLQQLTFFAAGIPVDAPNPQNGGNVLRLLKSTEGQRALALSEIKPA